MFNTAPSAKRESFYIAQNDNESKLNESFNVISEPVAVNLPQQATVNDIREIVRFLKRKSGSVTIAETIALTPRKVSDARKISAYISWGIIRRESELLELTALGQKLATQLDAEKYFYRKILHSINAYFAILEWLYDKNPILELVTYREVVEFLQQNQLKLNIKPLEAEEYQSSVTSFFSLCHAAELGIATIGKRSLPTRLQINVEELKDFINSSEENLDDTHNHPKPLTVNDNSSYGKRMQGREIYISSKGNENTVNLLSEILELADFIAAHPQKQDFNNGFLPPEYLSVMRQCQAGIFILDENDCNLHPGNQLTLSSELITEITVAQALLKKVFIVWHSSKQIPACLDAVDLPYVVAEQFDWRAAMHVAKSIKSFI